MLSVLLVTLTIAQNPGTPQDALLRAARAEASPEARRRWLLGWASLGGREEALPPALLGEGRAALERIAEGGPFRLFVSQLEDRLRVGLQDPAELVTRLRATVHRGDEAQELVRRESETPGRHEFRLDAPPRPEDRIVVEALADLHGVELVLDTVELRATPPPPPPDPRAVAESWRAPDATPRPITRPTLALDWWFWVAAGAAVGLAGLGIAQELRF